MFRTRVTIRDGVAVVAVLLAACLLLFAPWQSRVDGAFLVLTTPEGTTEYSLSSDRELTLTSQGVTLTVVIENGSAYVRTSDCPDGVCVRTGVISHRGESIVCVPLGVCVTLGKGTLDGVTG